MIFIKISFKYGDSTDTHPLRIEVFEGEQGFVDDVDDIDKIAWHLAIFDGNEIIGCARLFSEDDKTLYHAGRIAVKKNRRSEGIGFKIMELLKEKAIEIGADSLVLSSQMQAAGFYEKCGYEKDGEIYLDQDCPHIDMVLKL